MEKKKSQEKLLTCLNMCVIIDLFKQVRER